MENPCKDCLVMAVCLKPCDDLNAYAAVIIERENLEAMPAVDAIAYKYWMENIEIRPALKELYFNMKKKVDDTSLIRHMRIKKNKDKNPCQNLNFLRDK